MTDLSIRRIIINEISTANNYAYQAKKNKDAIAVTYFHGYADGLRNVLAQIEFVNNKELEEMEKEQCQNSTGPQND